MITVVLAMTASRSGVTAISLSPSELLQGRLLTVIVTGDRFWSNYQLVCDTLDAFTIGELHQGGATGADHCSKTWAEARRVPQFEHAAAWGTYGRGAGPIRNIAMIKEASPDLVVAFKNGLWDNPNGGTEHMVSLAFDTATPVWHVDEVGARWLQRP